MSLAKPGMGVLIPSSALLASILLLGSGASGNPPAPSQNPGIVQVFASELARYDRLVAISDVHGEYGNALQLLKAAGVVSPTGHWGGGKTLLIITGDSIDKGPQSMEVLALWMRLQAEAPASKGRVLALLGNHEAEMLADPAGDTKTEAVEAELAPLGVHVVDLVAGNSEKTVFGASLGKYRSFLRKLPVAARVGDWLFCHAGWIPAPNSASAPSKNWLSLVARERATLVGGSYASLLSGDGSEFLERKEFPNGTKWWKSPEAVRELERRLDGFGLRGVVFGHQPTAFGVEDGIAYYSASDRRMIKIDSGMAPEAGGHAGHLLLISRPASLAAPTASSVRALSGAISNGRLSTSALAVGG